jgi:hypothetical protein
MTAQRLSHIPHGRKRLDRVGAGKVSFLQRVRNFGLQRVDFDDNLGFSAVAA